METLQEQFDTLLEKGALEPIPLSVGLGFFSRIFLVPNTSGGVGPIIDLKALNKFCKLKRFKSFSSGRNVDLQH